MEREKISIEEKKNKGSMTSADKFKTRNEQNNLTRENRAQERTQGRAEFAEQQKTPGVKQEKLDVNVNIGEGSKTIEQYTSKSQSQTPDNTVKTQSVSQGNPHLEPPDQNKGMEHSFETGMAGENGGLLDQLTDQIGASIVEKATGNKDNQQPQQQGKSDKDIWNDIADEYAPSGVEDGKDKEMER